MADYKLRYYRPDGEKEEISFSPEGSFDFEYFKVEASIDGDRNIVKVTAKDDVEMIKCTRRGVAKAKVKDLCLINGYQSWTKTKEFFFSEKEWNVSKVPKPLLRKYAFDRYGDTTFFDYNSHILHGYDVFYVKSEDGAFIINANVKNAYLIIIADRSTGEISISNELDNLTLEAGESFTVSDYYQVKGYENGLAKFNELYPKKPFEKILGYTSWYNYYQNINEEIILRDLDALDDRFDLFQIDDGYESFVGDWLDIDPVKFPNGLDEIVKKTHERGYQAGIWLAPFVAQDKSLVFAEHPEWFEFENGEKMYCGSNWGGFYALNLELPEVKGYIRKCLEYYVELGFDFFKLDFLYASNLPAYKGKTRSMAAEDAYAFLREVLGDKIILGCGATISNAAGKFDYMRIGPDVSLTFDDKWYMKFFHNERVSTKNTIQNTIYRSIFDGRFFGNDPDVFLLRDDNIELTKEQRKALLTLDALFGTVLMTSDNLAAYDKEKKKTLTDALYLRDKAKMTSFTRKRSIITVEYMLDGEKKQFDYNADLGVIL